MTDLDGSVLQNIRKNYEDIFAAEQKVADFILSNPEKAVSINVADLAEISGASDATVIRLCKRLGYTGFYQMKLQLAHELGRNQLISGAINPDNPDSSEDLFREIAGKIVQVGANLDQDLVRECVAKILNSQVIHLIAVGNSIPVISDFCFRLGRAGIRATSSQVLEQQLNNINLGSENDLAIGISHSGSSKHILSAFELAKKKGMKTMAITDLLRSPAKDMADYTLSSGVETSSVYVYGAASHIYISAILDMIIYFITKAKNQSDYDLEVVLSETKM
ncbi:MAG: MurR/RpiR family transcriptional regulator [Eubacteriales bacterium]